VIHAAVFVTRVDRAAVRGLRMSICQSTSRLKAIAAVLAPTRHTSTPSHTRPAGIPSAATNIAPSPNGSANTVCSNLMNSAHFRMENFTFATLPHFAALGLHGMEQV